MNDPPERRKRPGTKSQAASTPPSDNTDSSKNRRGFDCDERVTPAIQPMPELAPEQLDALRSDIAANGVLQPVVVDQHGRILDGNHRAAIAQELGLDYPTVIITVQDDADAWDKAVTLNCARRHMTREQVREVIRGEIRRRPDDSDRAIAKRVGSSPTTVGSVRAEVRQWAEEMTEQIRKKFHDLMGQMAMIAQLRHRNEGQCWQTVGDVLERSLMDKVSELDDYDPETWDPIWRYVYGPFFDLIRSYDCPRDCKVCTDFDRKWRDDHPGQVYRWSDVSNLDTQAVTSTPQPGRAEVVEP